LVTWAQEKFEVAWRGYFVSFSVLLSIYFKEKPDYLLACFQSLANQTLKPYEVVLVEDGPISSNLKLIIEQYRGSLNIVSVCLSNNVGLAKALNEGLKNCTYDLVARMDTDDIALPERFEKQYTFMQENDHIAVCGAQIFEMDETMNNVFNERRVPLEHRELVNFMKFRTPFSHPVVMFRKKAILAVGGYPYIFPEDYILWVKLFLAGYQFHNLPDVLLKMRTGDSMLARRGKVFLFGILKTYWFMYKNNVTSFNELVKGCLVQSIVRLSPLFVRKLLYKYGRS
jgi:glycosyltransferase involved in cell wall biosynthesis